jgi:hypothetical protein
LIIGVLAFALSAVFVVAMVIGNIWPVVENPAASATPSPSSAPSTTTPTPVPLVHCPKGDPDRRAAHPSDGRVYGGNLSFPEQPTFDPAAFESRFSFAYDVLQQSITVHEKPGWIAQLAVGQLPRREGFVNDSQHTVESLAHCVITGKMYGPYVPTRSDIRSEGLSIDGHSGWLIESEITVDRPDLPLEGDHVIFIVVRDGNDWGFFFGAVPIGNAQLDAVLASTIRDLHAS